jgi:protein-S-isoprenylcysteine O-methyltransferase Ste14
MYTAMLLWGGANFLISSNGMVGAVQLLSVIILLVVRLPEEERMMEETFPRQYKLYKLKTYRLVPYIF